MTPNSFQYSHGNGTWNSVDDWGIRVIKHDFFAPEKRENKRLIPRVNGAYKADGRFYDERILRVECVWVKPVTRFQVRKVAGILQYPGRIQFSDEAEDVPDKDGGYIRRALYYEGEMFAAPELTTWVGETGRYFELEFSCYPFALGEVAPLPVSSGSNAIRYYGTYESPFVIALDNISGAPITNITITTIKKEV